MKIIMLGPPGSGKGTYSKRLSPKLGIPHISTGDIFRAEISEQSELGKKVEDILKRGELVSDSVVIDVIKKRFSESDAEKGYILDGFPRTINQAEELGKLAEIDVVINLVVPENIIVTRLSSRRTCRGCGAVYNVLFLKPKTEGVCDRCGGELIIRDDEKPEVIKGRLKVYERQTLPLIEYYREKNILKDIECNELDIPPEVMVDKIMGVLKKVEE